MSTNLRIIDRMLTNFNEINGYRKNMILVSYMALYLVLIFGCEDKKALLFKIFGKDGL